LQRGHWLLPSDKPGSGPCAVLRGVPNSELEGTCPAGVLVLDLGVRFKLRAPRWAQRHSDLGRPKPKRRATVAVAVCWLCAQVWQLTRRSGPLVHHFITPPPPTYPPIDLGQMENSRCTAVRPRPPTPGRRQRNAQISAKPTQDPSPAKAPREKRGHAQYTATLACIRSGHPGSACICTAGTRAVRVRLYIAGAPCPRALAQITPPGLSQSASAIESHVTET
jgi:hypothetical protein